jgi:1,4-alpha-glucan branching enzyme
MVRKSYYRQGKACRVTFTLPAVESAESVHLCGEFNDWDRESTPLEQRKDGRFSASVTLKPGRAYRYRYVLDGARWKNDPEADAYVPNPFGTEDSVVAL